MLVELEEKHFSEADKLYELIQLTTPQQLTATAHLQAEQLNEKLNLLNIGRNKLKEQSKKFLEGKVVDGMAEEEKREYEKVNVLII